jgi:PIN domain nuclease of toxin-antitoxin system
MGYLLDTHVLLWILDNSDNVSQNVYDIIEDIDNECFFSIVSLYEIAIKKNIGKLNTTNSIEVLHDELSRMNISFLPIKIGHLEKYIDLPQISNHKDPFDRLLIATAISENLPMKNLVTTAI